MNEHYENYDMDEMEIDLIDFLFYLLRRWKSLVAMILLGAILGSAFYVVKTTKSANDVVEDYQPDADTEANMKLAAQYRKLYDQQMNYNEHSIVMQMDPNQVYEGTLTYYLTAGEQTELLSRLYMNLINDKAVLAEIKDVAELDCDDQYIKELLTSMMPQNGVDESDVFGTVTNNMINQIQVVTSINNITNTMFSYQIDFVDKETCEKMLVVIQNAVDALKQEYEEIYGAYDLDLVQHTVTVSVKQAYMDKQNENTTLVDSYLTQLNKLEGAFSDTEKVYYQEVYLANENVGSEQTQIGQKSGITVKGLVKWLIIGIIGFIIFWGAYYFLKYLLDPSIKTLDDIKQRALPVIGYIKNDSKRENIITKIERKKNGECNTADYIATTINELSAGKILFCMDSDFTIGEDFEKTLKQKVANLEVSSWIQSDINTLELAKKMDGIILGIRLGKTSLKKLQRELEVCIMQKIPIIGIVGMEK